MHDLYSYEPYHGFTGGVGGIYVWCVHACVRVCVCVRACYGLHEAVLACGACPGKGTPR